MYQESYTTSTNSGIAVIKEAIDHSMAYIDSVPGLLQEGRCLQGAVEAMKFIFQNHPSLFENILLIGTLDDRPENGFSEPDFHSHFRLLAKYNSFKGTTWISAASGNRGTQMPTSRGSLVASYSLGNVLRRIQNRDGSILPDENFLSEEINKNSVPMGLNERGRLINVLCITANIDEAGRVGYAVDLIDDPVQHFSVIYFTKIFKAVLDEAGVKITQ